MPFDIEVARARLAELERAEPSELHRDIAALARPRMTGSEGAAEVEATLRERFDSLGYRAEELPFTFSTIPGRFGLTAVGALVLLTGALSSGLLTADRPGLSLVALTAGMAAVLVLLAFLGAALDRIPWRRVEASNLLFTRPDARPSWIVMAHRDSKAQLVPTLVRTGAAATAAVAWILMVGLAALRLGGSPLPIPAAVAIVGGAMVLTGAVLALSWARNDSPGALDNATGLAALLAAAARTDPGGEVAFLVTDGEELGLAGARAVAERLPPVQGVINIDGLDDRGGIHVAEGHGWRRTGTAPQLAAALLTAGAALGIPVARERLPLWLMVDHLPIAERGIPAVTVLKGGPASLLRIHRPSDRADRLTGAGAAESATLLAGALRLLREAGAPHLAGRRAAGS